jgi:hypothetical protein
MYIFTHKYIILQFSFFSIYTTWIYSVFWSHRRFYSVNIEIINSQQSSTGLREYNKEKKGKKSKIES